MSFVGYNYTESDSSEDKAKSETTKEKKNIPESEQTLSTESKADDPIETNTMESVENQEDISTPAPVVDGVCNNFHSYKAELEKRESKDLSLPNIITTTSTPEHKPPVGNVEPIPEKKEDPFAHVVLDHSYCLVPGKPKPPPEKPQSPETIIIDDDDYEDDDSSSDSDSCKTNCSCSSCSSSDSSCSSSSDSDSSTSAARQRDNDSKIVKRKRVRNKFYGYSTEEEELETQKLGMKWRKVATPSNHQTTPSYTYQSSFKPQPTVPLAFEMPNHSESSDSEHEQQ